MRDSTKGFLVLVAFLAICGAGAWYDWSSREQVQNDEPVFCGYVSPVVASIFKHPDGTYRATYLLPDAYMVPIDSPKFQTYEEAYDWAIEMFSDSQDRAFVDRKAPVEHPPCVGRVQVVP